MSKEMKYNRRQFLNNALMTFGVAELSIMGFQSNQFINQNLVQEAPKDFADAIIEADSYSK